MRGVSPYQLELLKLLSEVPEAEPLDFDQLLEKLSWAPSKESAQFTIRALVKKELIEKGETLELRRGRKRVTYQLTKHGNLVLDPRGPEIESISKVEDFAIPGTPEKVEKLDLKKAEKSVESIVPGLLPELDFMPDFELLEP